MTYSHQPKVRTDIAERSRKDIESVNQYVDRLRGVVVTLERIQGGQSRPYADTVDEYRLALHQPNMFTTNGPLVLWVSEADAKTMAKILTGGWQDKPGGWGTKLDYFRAENNPWGLDEQSRPDGKAACWHWQTTTPYCD